MFLGIGLPIGGSLGMADLPPIWASGEQGFLIDPANMGALYQDDAAAVPVTAAGQSVGCALDGSGRGNHAAQITTSKRPTFQIDGSGRPALLFDGVDDRLSSAPFMWGGDAVTLVAAIRRDSGGARQIVGFGNTATDAGSWGLLASSVSGDPVAYAARRRGTTGLLNHGGQGLWPASDVAVISMVARFAGPPLSRLRRNGVLDSEILTTGGSGVFGTWAADLGARPNDSAPFSGALYGVIAVSRVLTDLELQQAERWAGRRCGVNI